MYLWISGQVMSTLDSSATETNYNFDILDLVSVGTLLSWQRTAKVQIRLGGCAGYIFYDIKQSFAWRGSYTELKRPALSSSVRL